jgi:hypothetical protein
MYESVESTELKPNGLSVPPALAGKLEEKKKLLLSTSQLRGEF